MRRKQQRMERVWWPMACRARVRTTNTNFENKDEWNQYKLDEIEICSWMQKWECFGRKISISFPSHAIRYENWKSLWALSHSITFATDTDRFIQRKYTTHNLVWPFSSSIVVARNPHTMIYVNEWAYEKNVEIRNNNRVEDRERVRERKPESTKK